MGRKVPLRCFVRLHRRLLRPFSDSLRIGILGSSVLSWCSDVFRALEHIHLPHTGVSFLRYVAS
jgi:hypothetical protein